MNINLDAFRAIAGNDTSIGYAVLNSKGTGLEKADNHKYLSTLNKNLSTRDITQLEGDNNATVRFSLYSLMADHLRGNAALDTTELEDFLRLICKELGIDKTPNGELRISKKPLERRTIRAIFDAVDVFKVKAAANGNEPVTLTAKERKVFDLFGKANFADDKTDPGELMRLAAAVKRVKDGDTLAESVTVGGTKVTLVRDRDDATQKSRIMALFGSGIVDVDLNGGFLEGALKKSFENPSKLSKLALRRNLTKLSEMLEDQPLLSPVSVGAARLARTLIFAMFPKGLNAELFDQLSPRGMIQIAKHAVDGSYKKAANVNEAISAWFGVCNAYTGEKHNPGKLNELGLRIDQNINSAENDALVEKFLALEEKKKDQVQFDEKVRVPARPSETMSDEEVKKVLDECGGANINVFSIASALVSNTLGIGGDNVEEIEDVENIKVEDDKVEEKGDAFAKDLGEEDIEACEALFGEDLLSFLDVSDIWVEVKGEQTVSLVPADEPKAEEGQKEAPVAKGAEEKKAFSFDNLFSGGGTLSKFFSNLLVKPKSFSITTDSLKKMLGDEAKCRTLVRLMCNAGENGGNLAKLGEFEPHARLLYKVLNGMDGMKAVLQHFTPGNEKAAMAALQKAIRPLAGKMCERLEMLAKSADKFTFDGNIDCVSLLRSFCFYGNDANARKIIYAAARLLTLNMAEGVCMPESVKKLREGLLAAFGNLPLEQTGDKPVLLKDACTVDNTTKIADLIRGKMELAFNEKDAEAARLAVADLLQDADTWEMDKRADKPGERLKYSLDKNAAIFARLLCNPGHVKALGQPSESVANMMLSNLKDHLMTDKMRAELRPGNEQRVEKLLVGLIRSDELNKPNLLLGNKSILAKVEKMIDVEVSVRSRQMQAVTSCMFTEMLKGGEMPMSVDDITSKFMELSALFGKTNAKFDEVQCADAALNFIGQLPAGSTVVDFMDLYDAMAESTKESVKTQMDKTLSLLQELVKHPSVKVADLVALRKFYKQNSAVTVPELTTLFSEVAIKLPAGVSVTDFLGLIDEAYPQPNAKDGAQPEGEGVAQPGPSAEEKVNTVLKVITAAAECGVDAREAMALGKVLERQLPAEGESKVELVDFLHRISTDAQFSTVNFIDFFESAATGNGNVAKALDCMSKLRAGTKAADVLNYMAKNLVDFQSAVDIVQNLPTSRTLTDVDLIMGKLQKANIDCTPVQVMEALKYFDEPADKVGEAIVAIMSEAGFTEETKLEGDKQVVVRRPTLSFEGAVHLLHYLVYDWHGGKHTNIFDNRLKMLDNFKFVAEEKEKQSSDASSVSTGAERLLFMVLSKLNGQIVAQEHGFQADVSNLSEIEDAITRMIEAGGEEGSGSPIPMEEILRKAVDLLPKVQSLEVKTDEAVDNKKSSFFVEPELFTITKLNTPDFKPENGDKFPNLVQRLRMNGMNAEADEIDIKIEMNGEETDGTKAKEVAKRQKQLEARRLELSRMLLDKMSASATDTSEGYGKFMCKVMNRYFGTLDTVDARTMLSAACRYSNGGSPVQMLGAMLKGAGPIMQKMLQGLASIEELPKDFLTALEDMRSNLSDIPQTMVRAQLNELIEQSNGLIEKIEIDKPLGAASVGQTFLCKMKLKGEEVSREVVVKMLRPDAQKRLEREKAIFLKCAADVSGMKVTFEGQLASILEELDLRKEAENVKIGQVYNKGESDVSSMKLIPGVPVLKNVMVVEKAPGTTADRLMKQMGTDIDNILKPFVDNGVNKGYKDGRLDANFVEGDVLGNARQIADAQQKLIRMYQDALVQQQWLVTLAEKWANEGIYNGGFYHGDLHAGNIMLSPVKRDANGKVIGGGLTVIDFGNATQLTKEQQKAVMRMMMAATQQKTDIFMENFAVLMTPEGRENFNNNRKKGKKLDNLVEGLLNLGNSKDAEKRIFAVLQQLMLKGYEIPAAVYKFSQCTLRLQGTIAQMNGVMERIRHAIFDLSKLQVDSGIDPLNNFMGESGLDKLQLDEVGDDITRVYKLESSLGNETQLSKYLQKEIWGSFERNNYRGKLADPNVFTGEGFNADEFDISPIEKMVERYTIAFGADKCGKLQEALENLKTGLLAKTTNPLYLPARNLASARKAWNEGEASQSAKKSEKERIERAMVPITKYRSHMKAYGKNLDFVFEGLRNHKNKFKMYREDSKKEKKDRSKDYTDANNILCYNWSVTDFLKEKSSDVINMRNSKAALELEQLSFDEQGAELDKRKTNLEGQSKTVSTEINATVCTYNTYTLVDGKVQETPVSSVYERMDRKVLSDFRNKFNELAEDFKKDYIAPLTDELAKLVYENILPEFREKIGNGCTSTFQNNTMTLDNSAQLVPGGESTLSDFFDAIGEVIRSHLDEDLLKVNFGGGAIKFMKSFGYVAKGLPSIIGFIGDYGWSLTTGAIGGGTDNQMPV